MKKCGAHYAHIRVEAPGAPGVEAHRYHGVIVLRLLYINVAQLHFYNVLPSLISARCEWRHLWALHQIPTSQRFYELIIGFSWKVLSLSFDSNDSVMQQFCTCHDSWAHLILTIQSCNNFAHAMTAQLSWHVQICDMIWYCLSSNSNLKIYNIWIKSSLTLCEMGPRKYWYGLWHGSIIEHWTSCVF